MYPNGTREQKWIPTKLIANGKKNEIKAQKLLADIRVEYNKNSYISNKKTAEELLKERKELNKLIPKKQNSNESKADNITLSNDKLTSEEEFSVKNKVEASTYKGYYDHANGRIIPYFENEELLLRDVTLADIYNYIEYLFSEGLKPNTVKQQRAILSGVINRAVSQELFEYNFISKLEPIKSDNYIANFYKHEELLHLFDVVKNTPIRLEVIIAAVYGLRREEVIGLKWDCIDFKNKTLTIKHTVQRFKVNGKTQFIFKDKTKSTSSYRTLPLFNFIEELLIEYKKIYAEYKKLFGKSYNEKYQDYICLMPNGELMKPRYLTHTFSKILEDNGLKRIRLHDLRHSCATLLIQNKVPVKDIQIWLGHSDIQTTMMYTHMDETNKEVSAQVLINKFQYILENKKSQIYKMGNQALNNLYEDTNFLQKEKVVATVQN